MANLIPYSGLGLQKSSFVTQLAGNVSDARLDTTENNGTQDDMSDTYTVSSLSECSDDEAHGNERTALAGEGWSTEKVEADDPASLTRAESPVAGWPTEARALHGVSAWVILGNTLLIILPIPFLVLVVTAIGFNSNPISDRGQTLLRAMNLGPTIFLLVFAGVSSRCLKSIALISIESGIRVQTLEELLSSQSVVSAVACFAKLRSVNVLSVVLLMFWLLSPLGGQSSLRLLYETNSTLETNSIVRMISVKHCVTQPLKCGFWLRCPAPNAIFEFNEQTIHSASTVMAANLISPDSTKDGAFDLWGDVKVPRFDWTRISNDSTTPWFTLESNSTARRYKYTSWTGVTIRGNQPGRRSQSNMEYDYVDLTCTAHLMSENAIDILTYMTRPDIHSRPFDPPEARMARTIAQNATLDAEDMIFNRTVKAYGMHVPSLRPAGTFFKYAYNITNLDENQAENASYLAYFLYGARYTYLGSQVFQCLPTYVHLELEVQCQPDGQCSISRMRRTPTVLTLQSMQRNNTAACPANRGSLSCLLLNTATLEFFIDSWATILSTPTQTNGTDPYDNYIAALRDRTSEERKLGIPWPPWELINAEDLSARLTIAFNTYWQAISWQRHTMLPNAAGSIRIPALVDAASTEEADVPNLSS